MRAAIDRRGVGRAPHGRARRSPILRSLENAGYRSSRKDVAPAPLSDALLLAPDAPSRRALIPRAPGKSFAVDDRRGDRPAAPPGTAFDTGGTGKGLAADMLAERLEDFDRFVVDCGGDMRVHAAWAPSPFEVEIEHPLTGERAHVVTLRSGGVATSGLNVRVWKRRERHLRTPSHRSLHRRAGVERPVGATALARTALEAETLSKAALLVRPGGGQQVPGRTGEASSSTTTATSSSSARFRSAGV